MENRYVLGPQPGEPKNALEDLNQFRQGVREYNRFFGGCSLQGLIFCHIWFVARAYISLLMHY